MTFKTKTRLFITKEIIKTISESLDFAEMAFDKAKFEAEAELRYGKHEN